MTFRRRQAAVVGGENHGRATLQMQAFQSGQHPANRSVELLEHRRVSGVVLYQAHFAVSLFAPGISGRGTSLRLVLFDQIVPRANWNMHRQKREIGEEWPFLIYLDEAHRFA